MLISSLLLSKPIVIKKSGEQVIDLTKRTYNRKLVSLDDLESFIVDEDCEMRPDLISNNFYFTIKHWDAILKFNGISNPLSIERGTRFYKPKESELTKGFSPSPNILDKGIKRSVSQVLIPKTKFDKNRLADLLTKPLPNNIIDKTDANVKIRDGRIIFGEDVTGITNERCKGSFSRAKLKEKLLQNQIFE